MPANFILLWKEQKYTDAVLEVSGLPIRVHKIILASQSTVFGAMFDNMEERAMDRIKLSFLSLEVLKEVLEYLYSGNCPNLSSMSFDLLKAADKYRLERLKVMAQKEIAINMRPDTAISTLIVANDCTATLLKKVALQCVAEFVSQLVSTRDWQKLQDHPFLLTEIILEKDRMESKLKL